MMNIYSILSSQRSSAAQQRTGILALEFCRFRNISNDERLGVLCEEEEIENFHLYNPHYNEFSEPILNEIFFVLVY